MKPTLILLLFSCALWGQTLIYSKISKSKDKHWFYEGKTVTLVLKDGTKHHGLITTVNENTMIMNNKKGAQETIDNANVSGYIEWRHIWYFGARMRSLIQIKNKYNLEGYKYKFFPKEK